MMYEIITDDAVITIAINHIVTLQKFKDGNSYRYRVLMDNIYTLPIEVSETQYNDLKALIG